MDSSGLFVYDAVHMVFVCTSCAKVLPKDMTKFVAHIRSHRLSGDAIARVVSEKINSVVADEDSLISGDECVPPNAVRVGRSEPSVPVYPMVAGLPTRTGFVCGYVVEPSTGVVCGATYPNAVGVKSHIGRVHSDVVGHAVVRALCQSCTIQSYHSPKHTRSCFAVEVGNANAVVPSRVGTVNGLGGGFGEAEDDTSCMYIGSDGEFGLGAYGGGVCGEGVGDVWTADEWDDAEVPMEVVEPLALTGPYGGVDDAYGGVVGGTRCQGPIAVGTTGSVSGDAARTATTSGLPCVVDIVRPIKSLVSKVSDDGEAGAIDYGSGCGGVDDAAASGVSGSAEREDRVGCYLQRKRRGRCDGDGSADEDDMFLLDVDKRNELRHHQESTVVCVDGKVKQDRISWVEHTGFGRHLDGIQHEFVRRAVVYRSSDCVLKAAVGTAGRLVDIVDTECSYIAKAVEDDIWGEVAVLRSGAAGGWTYARGEAMADVAVGDTGNVRPFTPRIEDETVKRYLRGWVGCMVYSWRMFRCRDDMFGVTLDSNEGPGEVAFNEQQTAAAEVLRELLQTVHSGGEAAMVAVGRAVRVFATSLVEDCIGSRYFKSVICSYAAAIALRFPRDGNVAGGLVYGMWKEPRNVTGELMGLIWVMRLIAFNHVVRSVPDTDVMRHLRRIVEQYYSHRSESPYAVFRGWKRYLTRVAQSNVDSPSVLWESGDAAVVYKGIRFPLSGVCSIVRREFGEARGILHDRLLFGRRFEIEPVESCLLFDDLEDRRNRRSFVDVGRNAWLFETKCASRRLLKSIARDDDLRSEFMVGKSWESSAGREEPLSRWKQYEHDVQAFLRHMLVAMHFSCGAPLRGPELLSVRWCNLGEGLRRHVFVYEHRVMLRTIYSKTNTLRSKCSDTVHFLPEELGNLLLTFLAYVQPFRARLHQSVLRFQDVDISPFVFSTIWTDKAAVWGTKILSAAMKDACERCGVEPVTVSSWRQISIGIARKFVEPRAAVAERGERRRDAGKRRCIEESESDSDSEEDNGNGDDFDRVLDEFAAQGNHSRRTMNRSYAQNCSVVSGESIRSGMTMSFWWHDKFGLDDALAVDIQQGRSMSCVGGTGGGDRFRPFGPQLYTMRELERRFVELMGNKRARLRQASQVEALKLICTKERASEQVVLIAGTGSGKSMTYLLPAAMPKARTTIVVVPLVVLRTELQRVAAKFGITYVSFNRRKPVYLQESSIVCVLSDDVVSAEFRELAQHLIVRERLDRIVVDECHMLVNTGHYRACFDKVGDSVRGLRTQTVWLTATLPPTMAYVFLARAKLSTPDIIRVPTSRSNIGYSVEGVRNGEFTDESLALRVQQLWSRMKREEMVMDQTAKCIVFCQTTERVQCIAELLDAPVFYGRVEDRDEAAKAKIIADWLSDARKPVIVATSALGAGFDYPNVRLVVHVGESFDFTNFPQESGRAGRNGERSRSVVIFNRGDCDEPRIHPCIQVESNRYKRMYRSARHCLRGVISQYLDERDDWVWCGVDDFACSVCVGRPGGVFDVRRPSTVEFKEDGSYGGAVFELADYIVPANGIGGEVSSSGSTVLPENPCDGYVGRRRARSPSQVLPSEIEVPNGTLVTGQGSQVGVLFRRSPKSVSDWPSVRSLPIRSRDVTPTSVDRMGSNGSSVSSVGSLTSGKRGSSASSASVGSGRGTEGRGVEAGDGSGGSGSTGVFSGPVMIAARKLGLADFKRRYSDIVGFFSGKCPYCVMLCSGDVDHRHQDCEYKDAVRRYKVDFLRVAESRRRQQVREKVAGVDQPHWFAVGGTCCWGCYHPFFLCNRKVKGACPGEPSSKSFVFGALMGLFRVVGENGIWDRFGVKVSDQDDFFFWCGSGFDGSVDHRGKAVYNNAHVAVVAALGPMMDESRARDERG